jgi:hypothetical protein
MAGSSATLKYSAPRGCPPETEFVAAVGVRGGLFERAEPEGSGRQLDVSIRKDGAGFAGSFQVVDGGGASGAREVHASSCAEVMDGLAVVTAIALREDAEKTPATAPMASETPPVAVPPAPAPAPAPPPAVSPEPDEGRLRGRSEFGMADKAVEVEAGRLAFRKAVALTLAAGGAVGLVPSVVLPRYDFTFTRADFVTTPGARSYLIGPIVRVRASVLGEGTYRSQDLSTSAAGLSFGVGVCFSPIYDTRALVLLLCGEFGGGMMRFESKSAAGSQTQEKSPGFGTTALEVESDYNLGGTFHLNLKVGVDFLLNKLAAERLDGSEIFHSWQAAPYALAGLGLHF